MSSDVIIGCAARLLCSRQQARPGLNDTDAFNGALQLRQSSAVDFGNGMGCSSSIQMQVWSLNIQRDLDDDVGACDHREVLFKLSKTINSCEQQSIPLKLHSLHILSAILSKRISELVDFMSEQRACQSSVLLSSENS